MIGRADRVSLVAGLALVGLGVVLLLDQEGTIDLSLGALGAIVAAILGVILIVSGLGEEVRE